MEVALSTGVLEAMWQEDGLRPVLQLANEPRMAGRYRVALSDGGARLQPGMLSASLNHLVARGELRRGTVIRVLEYFAGLVGNQRVIILIQLEILHAECTLIRSPTIFEANATKHITVSCGGGLAIHEPCFMPCTQQVISNSSYSPDNGVLDTSITPRAEPTVINLPFSESFSSMPAKSTVGAKMKQLSLNDHQSQRFTVTATGHSGAMAAQLTPGAMVAIVEHADGDGTLQPMLQVVDIQMVNNVKFPSAERFRMVLSDGVYMMQSMLVTAKNMHVWDGSIQKGSIIHLQEFTCNTIQNRRIIIVIKLDVLQSQCNIIGNPKPYEMRNQPDELVDDDSNIPKQYNFRQIREIENIEALAVVDLVGIVTSVGPAIVMQKDGTQAQKRTLQLKDMSARSIEIILWGKVCDAEGHQLQLLCDSGANPILSLKGGLVCDFSGRSVVIISSTQLKVNPDFPVAERLKQWYITEGKNTACISLSRKISNMSRNHVRKTIAQIKDENLGRSACTLELNGRRCYKKVTSNGDGTWYCGRCNQHTESCEYKYVLLCQIKDHTGTIYATAFQKAGEAIFGHTAQELFMIRNVEQDDAAFTNIMQAVLWREYLFKLRVDEQTYNGEQRVRYSIIGVQKLEETDNLLTDVSGPSPNVGSANLEARQSMLSSSNANGCAIGVGGKALCSETGCLLHHQLHPRVVISVVA